MSAAEAMEKWWAKNGRDRPTYLPTFDAGFAAGYQAALIDEADKRDQQ